MIVTLYIDGACSGNGTSSARMGVAYISIVNGVEVSQSKSLGFGTNQIAELESLRFGIESLYVTDLSVCDIEVYTDSQYVIGLFSMGWKAKANTQIVEDIKQLIYKYSSLTFNKVKGHSVDVYNNRVDKLAVCATKEEE